MNLPAIPELLPSYSIFGFSAGDIHKAARNIPGIAREAHADDGEQFPLSVCPARTMSTLLLRRTNISPKGHRSRANPTAMKALTPRIRHRRPYRAVAISVRDFAAHHWHRSRVGSNRSGHAPNQKSPLAG